MNNQGLSGVVHGVSTGAASGFEAGGQTADIVSGAIAEGCDEVGRGITRWAESYGRTPEECERLGQLMKGSMAECFDAATTVLGGAGLLKAARAGVSRTVARSGTGPKSTTAASSFAEGGYASGAFEQASTSKGLSLIHI